MIATARRYLLVPVQRVYSLDAIFDYIVAYKSAHDGNSPTVRQITAQCGISSTSVTAYNLGRLAADGRIRIGDTWGATRSIEVVGGKWGME